MRREGSRKGEDFKDGHMNREPRAKPEVKKFAHGAKETIKGETKTPRSPMQRAEAKVEGKGRSDRPLGGGREAHRSKEHEGRKTEHKREPRREVKKDEHRGEVKRMERKHHESPQKAGEQVRKDKERRAEGHERKGMEHKAEKAGEAGHKRHVTVHNHFHSHFHGVEKK